MLDIGGLSSLSPLPPYGPSPFSSMNSTLANSGSSRCRSRSSREIGFVLQK
jgi:hypothetical protein